MKQNLPRTSTALQGTGLALGHAFDGAVLKTAIPVQQSTVSPQRLRLIRARFARIVRLHSAASNAAILAAFERRLMKADPKRYPSAAACASVTGFIGRVLKGERNAIDALNEFAPRGGLPGLLKAESDVLPASFAAGSPRENSELSEVMRALA